VRRTALAKIVVMGAAGIFGLINTRLITSHFGADAYAQYGLLASFPNLMPFTDLGIGAVILNTVAGSSDLRHDMIVRRTLTTAIRVLLGSALVIATTGIVLGLLGAWPTLLGAKLMDGGGATASFCLLVYAAALPLSVGQRVVVGMGRTATQVISQGVVSPALTCMLLVVVIARIDAGNGLPGGGHGPLQPTRQHEQVARGAARHRHPGDVGELVAGLGHETFLQSLPGAQHEDLGALVPARRRVAQRGGRGQERVDVSGGAASSQQHAQRTARRRGGGAPGRTGGMSIRHGSSCGGR